MWRKRRSRGGERRSDGTGEEARGESRTRTRPERERRRQEEMQREREREREKVSDGAVREWRKVRREEWC